jgi:hypothetical protein
LLGRVGTRFLNVRPRASKKRQSVVVLVETPPLSPQLSLHLGQRDVLLGDQAQQECLILMP